VDFLAVASGIAGEAARLAPGAEAEPLFQINLFQVIIAATNFVVFLASSGRCMQARPADAGRTQGADRGAATPSRRASESAEKPSAWPRSCARPGADPD
jgi:hypothetical protein